MPSLLIGCLPLLRILPLQTDAATGRKAAKDKAMSAAREKALRQASATIVAPVTP